MTPDDTEPGALDHHRQERRLMAVQVAVLETQVKTLSRDMAELKQINQKQTETLNLLLQSMSEARGSWRTLMLLSGAAAAIGSGLTWALAHIRVAP